ncbi:hypothetical protein FKW77_004689 [Venturia effusa]|uniref:Uncharacterized protein n=1 Tax=Venturia effusa TaxID=50376 RepID=A0A517L7A0_9PEZI|nr:hypothetical protein FKW77_004689 [Venturia effusa]
MLKHGASVDHKEGSALCAAVAKQNVPLILRLLEESPGPKTVVNAFDSARTIDCSNEMRFDIFDHLTGTGCEGLDLSQALIEAVRRDVEDVRICRLLLVRGASLDHRRGEAMQGAAAAAAMPLLGLFFERGPSITTRDAAFHAAIYAELSASQIRQVFAVMIEAGIFAWSVSSALLVESSKPAPELETTEMLVKGGASLDFEEGSALSEYCLRHDVESLEIVLQAKVTKQNTLSRGLIAIMSRSENVDRPLRQDCALRLLQTTPGVEIPTISALLTQVVLEQDHELLRLFMSYNPDPGYNNAESIIAAASLGDLTCVKLLCANGLDSPAANLAFVAMLDKQAIQSTPDGYEVCKLLLESEIMQEHLDRCLVDAFDHPINDLTKALVVTLTLYKANFSSANGKAFVTSAKVGETDLFDDMVKQKPELNIVITALIEAFAQEHNVDAIEQGAETDEDVEHRIEEELEDAVLDSQYNEPEVVRSTSSYLNHGTQEADKLAGEA